MSDAATTFLTFAFVFQVVGYGAFISTMSLQRKRLDGLTVAINRLVAVEPGSGASVPTSGKAGDSK